MSFNIKLEMFEGPLDLLLHLIDQAELDVYEISVAEVTEQYLNAIQGMQQLELEFASEFLVMAATLLAMKSRSLLPKTTSDDLQQTSQFEADEEDPREELIRRLVEYKKFKQLADRLKECQVNREQVFTRVPTDLSPFLAETNINPAQGVTVYHLVDAFQSVMSKVRAQKKVARVQREPLSINEQIKWLIERLERKRRISFFELFDTIPRREVIVVTFLALLELIKKRVVTCRQHGNFDDIYIYKRDS